MVFKMNWYVKLPGQPSATNHLYDEPADSQVEMVGEILVVRVHM